LSALYSKQSTSEVYNHLLRPHLVKQSTSPNEREKRREQKTCVFGGGREEKNERAGQATEKKRLRSAFLGFGVCVTGLHACCHGGYGCRRRRRSLSLFLSFHPPHSSSRKSPHNQPNSHIFNFFFFSSSWFFCFFVFFFFGWLVVSSISKNQPPESMCLSPVKNGSLPHGDGVAGSEWGRGREIKVLCCVVMDVMSCHVMSYRILVIVMMIMLSWCSC